MANVKWFTINNVVYIGKKLEDGTIQCVDGRSFNEYFCRKQLGTLTIIEPGSVVSVMTTELSLPEKLEFDATKARMKAAQAMASDWAIVETFMSFMSFGKK